MPGKNYSVVGCGTSRQVKGIGIFKLPSAEKVKQWIEKWLGEITKTRTVDKHFKDLISEDHVYTCEKHFRTEDIETCKKI